MRHFFSLLLPLVFFAVHSFSLDLFSSFKPEKTYEKNNSSQSVSLDLLSLFKSDDTWEKSPNAFVIAHRKNGFVYTDNSRSSAYSVKRKGLSFGSLPVYEAHVFWDENKLSRVEISIFNKGDAGKRLNQKDFEQLLKQISDILDANFGKGLSSPPERLANRMYSYSKRWSTDFLLAHLQWALTRSHRSSGEDARFSAEYLRLIFVRATGFTARDNAVLTGKSILVKPKRKSELRNSVGKNAKGDVWISGIPMVDQGQKGYCAAATCERVLRYYGLIVDQHQVAQLAETGAKSGTSFKGFADAVENIGRYYSLDKEVLMRPDSSDDFSKSNIVDDLKAYNKVAKRKGVDTVDWHDYTTSLGHNMFSIDVSSILSAIDPEILLESKISQKARFEAFSRDIIRFVDAGCPLMWSCFVGLFPEVPDVGAVGAFGHMRLIIGYNKKTKEILYSDSWGAGHGLKRMPIDMAWAMTQALVVLEPRN